MTKSLHEIIDGLVKEKQWNGLYDFFMSLSVLDDENRRLLSELRDLHSEFRRVSDQRSMAFTKKALESNDPMARQYIEDISKTRTGRLQILAIQQEFLWIDDVMSIYEISREVAEKMLEKDPDTFGAPVVRATKE
jgi:hypothetical protein